MKDVIARIFPTYNAFLFLVVGICNGSLVDAIWFEYPWFELSQPEGVDLVLSMALALCIGCVLFFGYILWDIWARPSINSVALWVIIISTALTILMALTWHWSISGVSISILWITCISSFLSCLQWAVLIPWVATMDDPRYLSQYIAGEYLMAGINVFIEIAQQPGDAQNFSPFVYFCIIAISYLVAIWAIITIINNNIGNPIEFKGLKRESLTARLFPHDAGKVTYWLSLALWNNLLCNCFLSILLPYVAYNTGAENEGAIWLQWAYAVSSLANLFGTLASYSAVEGWFCLTETTFIMTICSIPLMMAGFGLGDFTGGNTQMYLYILLALVGVTAGWQLPLTYRAVCETFPDRASQLSTYLSYWLVLTFVVTYGAEGILQFVNVI